jgi:hypothetical protein
MQHMIDALLIINEAGSLLYNWHPKGSEQEGKDDLFSGFLTAINSFATFERGEDIKSLKLQETSLIFEKKEDLLQKLTFVVTTKNESLIELLHAFIHEVMNEFTSKYEYLLNKEFNGDITEFKNFTTQVEKILRSLGLDVLQKNINEIDKDSYLKSIITLEPKGGIIYFIYAKQYINKDKISFLIPLVLSSARLLYQNHLNETVNWILLTTVKNEIIVVETREKVLLVNQYDLLESIEEDYLSMEFFKDKEKYIKKPNKLIEKFSRVKWDSRVKQFFLVDLVGKIFYSEIFDAHYDCSDYIPETISFLTSSRKTSAELYSRVLFNAAIGGEKIVSICINFNNFVLTIIGSLKDFNDYNTIQNLCIDIYKQIK